MLLVEHKIKKGSNKETYIEGKKAKVNFQETMKALFRSSKKSPKGKN